MKYCSAFAFLFLVIAAGCTAGAPEPGSATDPEDGVGEAQDAVTGWLGPISDEAAYNHKSFGQPNIAATGAYCKGSYCDNNWLYGSILPGYAHTGAENPTGNFISEEAPNNFTYCKNASGFVNGVVTGLAASGKYSDNLELLCSPVSFNAGHGWGACQWTAWFSEEQGYQWFPAGYFATGLQCSGSYCDNVRYYVCSMH